MIGRRIDALYPRTPCPATDRVVLQVEGLSAASGLADISFQARAGEVVGFFGLMGAGRTELAKAIVGFDPLRTGRITIDGQALAPHDTATGVSLGIGLLTEDRKREGLMLDLPVVQNATLAALGKWARGPFVDRKAERQATQGYVDRFRIRTPSLDQPSVYCPAGTSRKC